MKVVALVSGGKDSCYAAMKCVAYGHELVALANLKPVSNVDEADSYMYQTVGQEGIQVGRRLPGALGKWTAEVFRFSSFICSDRGVQQVSGSPTGPLGDQGQAG